MFSARTSLAAGLCAVMVLMAIFTGSLMLPSSATAENAEEVQEIAAPDFTLVDQYGETHTLSGYAGKVVFMNFWTTWCPYCIEEMPEIEELYHELGENKEDVVILGMCAPSTHDTEDMEDIIDFVEEHGWTYPMLMDETGDVFNTYIADGFPTTWLIKADGNVMGYVSGMMSKDMMMEAIQMTLDERSVQDAGQGE